MSSNPTGAGHSMIDVTGQIYRIPDQVKQAAAVVPWAHFHVYTYEDLYAASQEQRLFYEHFKNAFEKQVYLDLKGYNNYAFILLFDILRSYDSVHRDSTKLEVELKALGVNYYRTYSYCLSFLQERLERIGDKAGIRRLNKEKQEHLLREDWRLGNQYAKQLSMSQEQVQLLNAITYSKGNFGEIEACFLEVLQLFNNVVAELDKQLVLQDDSLVARIDQLVELSAIKNCRYKKGSQDHEWYLACHPVVLYEHILKCCDNAVRQKWGYSRTKNTDCPYTDAESKQVFEQELAGPLSRAVARYRGTIGRPDEETELILNEQSTTRWKPRFEEIVKGLSKDNIELRTVDLARLTRLNARNPALENIYFEAAKEFTDIDKPLAVQYYFSYIHTDMQSVVVNNKPLPKTVRKRLFLNNEEAGAFDSLVIVLKQGADFITIVSRIPEIFGPKRRKIEIDTLAIQGIQSQHTDTVGLLNAILAEDEPQPEVAAPVIMEPVTENTGLPAEQHALLMLFAAQGFFLSDSEITDFAKSRGLFKNRLIDSLNESCYDLLDDVLIEEADDGYQIPEPYYQKLTA